MSTIFLLDLVNAQRLKSELDEAREALETSLSKGIEKLAPIGSIIDRRRSNFGTINVAHGNSRNAISFEVASKPAVELDLGHPGLSRFTIDAYPLNDAGKRMSGRVAKSYGLGRRETVQLRINILVDRHESCAEEDLDKLAAIAVVK